MSIPDFRSLIQYNPDTGSFKWLVSVSGRRRYSSAGGYDGDGYLRIRVNGTAYSAASIAWYLSHGEWPRGIIDHIDHNPANNRLDNLRHISQGLNCLNRRRWPKTGMPIGVFKERGRYRVIIHLLNTSKSLGSYDTLEEATVVAEAGHKKQWELMEKWWHAIIRDRETKQALLKELNLESLGFISVHRRRGPKLGSHHRQWLT